MKEDSRTESTADLLARVRSGDQAARERLAKRYLPMLRGIAHGRLPRGARDLLDTDDLVQNTLHRALNNISSFEPRWEGAFLAYLRRAVINQVRDEARRAARRKGRIEVDDDLPSLGPSPLDELIGHDLLERYEEALGHLRDEQREAVILRLEMGYSYAQIAEALGGNSPNAVRMMISRALAQIAKRMKETGSG
jgi:RNA polymerase sigma-70 factor, ECF subfamily